MLKMPAQYLHSCEEILKGSKIQFTLDTWVQIEQKQLSQILVEGYKMAGCSKVKYLCI